MNQTIGVNITPQSFQPTLHFSQGDVGRVFVVNVTDYDIPSGATVTCVATKPSGMGFTVSGTVSGNSVTFTSTAEMTDEWGRFPAEIRIASGNTLLGTANFLMVGEKDPHPASTIDGTQEELIPQLTLLVNRVEAAAESVHDLTVSATTLAAGSDATATYDSTNNSIAFGIPRGADGDVTRSEFNDLKSEINYLGVIGTYTASACTIQGFVKLGGGFDTSAGFHRTDYIDVGNNRVRVIGRGKNINNIMSIVCFYDENKQFLWRYYGRPSVYTEEDFDILAPAGTRYVILSRDDATTNAYMQIVKANDSVDFQLNKYIDSSGAVVGEPLSTGYNWIATDYIEIFSDDVNKVLNVYANGASATKAVYFYDDSYTPISGITINSTTMQTVSVAVPMNAKYYRCCCLWDCSGLLLSELGASIAEEAEAVTSRTIKPTDYTIMGYIKASGVLDAVSGFHSTDYIYVGDAYKNIVAIGKGSSVNGILSLIAFYDSEKNFLGSYVGNYTSGVHLENFKFKVPKGTYYVRLSAEDSNLASVLANIYFLNDEERIMRVGYGSDTDNDFDSVTDAFKATETEPKKCIIHINKGEYDVFEELGGEDFISSLANTDTAYTIDMPWLYNVDVIGHGKVKLIYSPDPSFAEHYYYANGLVSPLNVRGDVTIENIEIDAEFCRYAIHDETGSSVVYDDTYHIYKNVIAKMGQPYCAYGNTVGSGMKSGQHIEWNNCRLINTAVGAAYACHSTPSGKGGLIKIIDCYLETAQNPPLKLGNWGNADETDACVNNCYINSINGNDVIRLALENSGVPSANSFQLYVTNTNAITVTIDDTLTSNPYTPVVVQF